MLFAHLARLSFLTGTRVLSVHWSYSKQSLLLKDYQLLTTVFHVKLMLKVDQFMKQFGGGAYTHLELAAIQGIMKKNSVCLSNVFVTTISFAAGGWDGRRICDWCTFSVCWLLLSLLDRIQIFFPFFPKVCPLWNNEICLHVCVVKWTKRHMCF